MIASPAVALIVLLPFDFARNGLHGVDSFALCVFASFAGVCVCICVVVLRRISCALLLLHVVLPCDDVILFKNILFRAL